MLNRLDLLHLHHLLHLLHLLYLLYLTQFLQFLSTITNLQTRNLVNFISLLIFVCFYALSSTCVYIIIVRVSCVLAVRPARRTDASAPLSAGAASPPSPPVGMGRGESAAPELTS